MENKIKNRRFIGVDLHTNKFNICELKENSDEKQHQQFFICDEHIENFISMLDKNTMVMLEACTNAFQFAKCIQPFAGEVIVADTHKLKLISNTNKKTDKIDAEKIATLLKVQVVSGEELINKVYIPNDDMQELRGLFSSRRFINNEIVSVKNKIHSLLKEYMHIIPRSELTKTMRKHILSLELTDTLRFQFELFLDQLSSLEDKKKKLEEKIKLIGVQFYDEVEILTSAKGISVLSALGIMADICDIKRFKSKKHLCSYLRSAPAVESSNGITKIKKINKFSRKLSISFITQAITHIKKANPGLKIWCDKKTQKGSKGKIRMGACRRFIAQIYCMLDRKEYHHFREEKNHLSKMNEYNRFLNKHGIYIESYVA